MRKHAGRLLAAFLVLLVGCATTRFENLPLDRVQANEERRAIDVSHEARPIVLVAISGGGARAAALGWVVLRELGRVDYQDDGQSRRLVDDVGIVSSVSGGSVIGAYFALYGADGLEGFRQDFLLANHTRALRFAAIDPFTWVRLMLTGSGRVDVVEDMFDASMFHKKTLAELNQPGKPYLIMNATDMDSGEVFAFTPQRFDDICSSFDQEPISVAVGASSAFPVLSSPVAFKNHSKERCADRPPPQWMRKTLTGMYAPYISLEEYKRARYANDLRHGQDSFREIDYLYLQDGGLADNLGIHGLIEAISSPHAAPVVAASVGDHGVPGTVLNAINSGFVKKVVVLVVNARSDPQSRISVTPRRPGIFGMIDRATTVPIHSNTAAVSSQLEVLLAQIGAGGAGGPGEPKYENLSVYPIQVDFDQLRGSDPVQNALRGKVKSIPTSWTIDGDDLATLEQVGPLLLRRHPCFQRLLLDLGARLPGYVPDEVFAREGCRQAADS